MKSIVKELAVYRNGCLITRQGTINLNKGKQRIILDNLTKYLDVNSFSLHLPETLKGSNVQLEELNQDEIQDITKEIDEKIKDVDNKIVSKERQIEMYNLNADFTNKTSLDISQMTSYIDKLPEKISAVQNEINDLYKQKEILLKEKEEKTKETNTYKLIADIEVNEDGEYPFVVKYKDERAYWLPVYEIHSLDNDELSVLFKAKINQNIDEDLSNVKLSLFTSNPTLSMDIPTLYPQRLNIYSPRINVAGAGLAKMSMNASMDMLVEEEMPYEEMSYVSNTVGTSIKQETMTIYELDGLYDLKNNNEIVLDVERHNIACKYHVIAVPSLSDCGYLAAEVKVSDIQDLLYSNAVIYHQNTYVGETTIDVDLDLDTYDISLGRDETISIKKKQNKKYTSSVLLKGQKKIDFEYTLNVNSTKDKKCLITLYDQVPVSQDKSINVDIINISKAKLEEETGKLTWEFELNEKENKTFDLAYSISYPKDKKINI